MKQCSTCQTKKPLEDFTSRWRKNKAFDKRAQCKECLNKVLRKWRKKPTGIWYMLFSEFKKSHRRRALVKLSKSEFIEWYNKQNKECYYCHISETNLQNLKPLITPRFTIDRKNNNLPYTISNIVLACHRCNMIKGYTFSEKEMLEIAQKYLLNRF